MDKHQVVSAKLPTSLVDQLDHYIKKAQPDHLGTLSRSSIIHRLIVQLVNPELISTALKS
jgi:metal-responsive CopG/Arc/MetJ family transcriptional regulator